MNSVSIKHYSTAVIFTTAQSLQGRLASSLLLCAAGGLRFESFPGRPGGGLTRDWPASECVITAAGKSHNMRRQFAPLLNNVFTQQQLLCCKMGKSGVPLLEEAAVAVVKVVAASQPNISLQECCFLCFFFFFNLSSRRPVF